MRSAFIIIIFIFFSRAFGQVDPIEEKIKNYCIPHDMITKGRNLMMNEFKDESSTDVYATAKYIITRLEDSVTAGLKEKEKELIGFIFRDYEMVLKTQHWDSINPDNGSDYSEHFPADSLRRKLYDFFRANVTGVISDIKKSSLDSIQKKLLELKAFYLAKQPQPGYYDFKNEVVDSLANEASQLMWNKPELSENTFLKNLEREKKLNPFGASATVGFSGAILGEQLKQDYADVLAVSFGLKFIYRRFYIEPRFNAGGSSTKKDLTYDTVLWNKGGALDAYSYKVNLGCRLFYNRYVAVNIYSGLGSFNLQASDDLASKRPALKGKGYRTGAVNSMGVSIDLKMFSKFNRKEETYSNFTVDYSYNVNLLGGDKFTMPLYHNITVGFGYFSRAYKQDY